MRTGNWVCREKLGFLGRGFDGDAFAAVPVEWELQSCFGKAANGVARLSEGLEEGVPLVLRFPGVVPVHAEPWAPVTQLQVPCSPSAASDALAPARLLARHLCAFSGRVLGSGSVQQTLARFGRLAAGSRWLRAS